MTTPRYCPFNNRPCQADCALFQHEGCALANGAGSLYGIMHMLDAIKLLIKMVIMPETLPADAADEPAPEEIGGTK